MSLYAEHEKGSVQPRAIHPVLSPSHLCANILLMSMPKHKSNKKEVEQQVNQWLSKQASIRFAILFGSFAKQTNTQESDIDLAIELDKPLTAETKLTLLQTFSELNDRRIDLIDLKTVGEPLLNQIIQHGKLLKGTKADMIQLSIKNVNMMQDFSPYLKRTLAERRARLLHG